MNWMGSRLPAEMRDQQASLYQGDVGRYHHGASASTGDVLRTTSDPPMEKP